MKNKQNWRSLSSSRCCYVLYKSKLYHKWRYLAANASNLFTMLLNLKILLIQMCIIYIFSSKFLIICVYVEDDRITIQIMKRLPSQFLNFLVYF